MMSPEDVTTEIQGFIAHGYRLMNRLSAPYDTCGEETFPTQSYNSVKNGATESFSSVYSYQKARRRD